MYSQAKGLKVMQNKVNEIIPILILSIIFSTSSFLYAQRDSTGTPMFINVNAINLELKKLNGEGQFTNQYSWMLTGDNRQETEVWYYPCDQWHSQLLYQIYNPIAISDSGIIDEDSIKYIIPPEDGSAFRSVGVNVYSWERRRYRPPYVTVDNIPLYREYTGTVDPNLPADMIATWKDILRNFGLHVRVDLYAYSNPNHDNYFIWKTSYKFTGETRPPIEDPGPEDFFPDQSIKLWIPLAWSFGPSKAGEREVTGTWPYEGTDDLDSWFEGPSKLVTGLARNNLKIAYYWDYKSSNISAAYPNGSKDDIGDPDRGTGHLLSPQIPGFALLHASSTGFNSENDDTDQPYSMPHASILSDFWGRRDLGRRDTYIGDDSHGRFPLDPITENIDTKPSYGPMRFITIGPYELEKNSATGVYDSVCAVYAIAVGSISWEKADSVGKAWFQGDITDEEKDNYIMTGRDSLFNAIDRAFWTWSRDFDIPDPPPPPDVTVISDADRVQVKWSYPDEDYFKDPDTGVDDWYAWRVYRKKGAAYVNDPLDDYSGDVFELIYETRDRTETTYLDTNVTRGVSYYYAVTAVDDGTQNTDGLFPGQKLESSRFVNRTGLPAIPFKGGLNVSDKVRIVPNPATIDGGGLNFPGRPDVILFARLPYKCTLKIFTETGDLVTVIEHFGTDQEEWNQRNDANQYVSSGLYILAVTNAVDEDGNSLAEQFEKFVIVR
ncbi:MAG: hypothetical protein J7L22_08590 [Candidatus Marinimicrobia bacterium]|nr:hypothetical protein [Candidatus Neomarinimicrobiota bacterium]